MYFLSESYGHGSFSEMLDRFLFVLPHVSIEGGVWIGGDCGAAAASLSSWYLKSKLLISNLIFLLGDKFLISAATSMPNKLLLVGVDCNDLLMSSIIFDSLLVFSGACLTSSLRFLLCNVFAKEIQMIGWSKHSKISSFRSNHWNCLQLQSCHRRLG